MHINHLLQRARRWPGKYLASASSSLLLALGLSSLPAAPAQALSCGSNNGYTCTGSSDQYAGGFSPGWVMVASAAATAPPRVLR